MSSEKIVIVRLLTGTLLLCLLVLSCSGNTDNRHTTATTVVPPPPHQVLRVVSGAELLNLEPSRASNLEGEQPKIRSGVDPRKPILEFSLPDGTKFRESETVVVNFTVANARLKGDGGEYRVRYIVDDDEMKLIDKAEPFGLVGWVPGKHTIRLELIGPDGWPYRNGDANIITREITVY